MKTTKIINLNLKDGRKFTLDDCDLRAISRMSWALSVGPVNISVCDILEICGRSIPADDPALTSKTEHLLDFLALTEPRAAEPVFEIMRQTGNGENILWVEILQVIANLNIEWIDRHNQVSFLLQQRERCVNIKGKTQKNGTLSASSRISL